MLLPGYKYLDRSSLGAPRLASLTAVRLPALGTVVATASWLEPLCAQLLTHDRPGSRRRAALEPLLSPPPLPSPTPFLPEVSGAELLYDSLEGSPRSSLMTSAVFAYQFREPSIRTARMCARKTRRLSAERMQPRTLMDRPTPATHKSARGPAPVSREFARTLAFLGLLRGNPPASASPVLGLQM